MKALVLYLALFSWVEAVSTEAWWKAEALTVASGVPQEYLNRVNQRRAFWYHLSETLNPSSSLEWRLKCFRALE